jgi:hypothetical protein
MTVDGDTEDLLWADGRAIRCQAAVTHASVVNDVHLSAIQRLWLPV